VKEIDDAMSSPLAWITGATAAIAELPQIELPQATRIESRIGRPRTRQITKLTRIATATTRTIAPSNSGPEATSASRLIEAPSSMTATSSSCLALKAMPRTHRRPGFQAVRNAMPSRIARTRASM